MQTVISISLILLALTYLAMKWMPAGIKEKLYRRLLVHSPKLASSFAQASRHCESSCSSSCHGCSSQAQPPSSAKPVIWMNKD